MGVRFNTLAAILAAAPSGPQSYVGVVATRSALPNSYVTNNSSSNMMNRTTHYAVTAMTDAQLIYSTAYGGSNNEGFVSTGTMTVRAGIEYNGQFHQVLFAGLAEATASNPAAMITSDLQTLPFTIPAGAQFFVRTLVVLTSSNSVFPLYNDGARYWGPATGDTTNASASALTDQTLGGTVSQTAFQTTHWRPFAILGTTTKGTIAVMGDSINRGTGGSTNGVIDSRGLNGMIMRMFSADYGVANVAANGDDYFNATQAAKFLKRAALIAACNPTVIVDGYGTNDLGNAGTLTVGNLNTYINLLKSRTGISGKPYWRMTLPPRNSSSGTGTAAERLNYISGSQPIMTSNASRVAWNNAARNKSGITIDGHVETTAGYEATQDSGIIAYGLRTRVVNDAAISTGTNVLTSATAAFTLADDGTMVVVMGAGSSAGQLLAQMVYVNATTVNLKQRNTTLNQNASTTVSSGGTAYIGHMDNTIEMLHPSAIGELLAASSNANTAFRAALG